MKKKLPEKKSSYKNSYLDEIREAEIFLNSWTRRSLIELLIRKFFNNENFINSFYFRTVTLSRDFNNSRNNRIFILNTLMLFALPVFISIYRSTNISIVEQNNFDLAEFKKRAHHQKDYNMTIYIKYFRSLIKNFDISPRNFCILGDIDKSSRNDFSMDIIPVFYEGLLEGDNLFEIKRYDSIYGFDFSKEFLDFYISTKGVKNRDCFRLRKRILQNLRSWGESDEIMVKSSSLLKKKGNLYLSNYMKFNFLQLSRDQLYHLDGAKQKVFTGRNSKYFDSELNNTKFFITLEKIISDSIYKFSRYLLYESVKSENPIIKTNLLTKQFNNNNKEFIDSDYAYINRKLEKNTEFMTCINLDQFNNWNTYKYDFGWIKKFMYMGNRAFLKPVFIDPISFNKSLDFSKKKLKSYFYFFGRYPTNSNDKYIINNLFSRPKIKMVDIKKSICYLFPEQLLIDRSNQNVFNTDLNKISKNIGMINYLKKNIESDDIGIISWKIHKYHSNFLSNYYLPFNVAYDMIRENYSMSKEIPYIFRTRWNHLFLKILHLLLSIFSKFKKNFLFLNRIELQKHLVGKNKELDLFLSESNKIKDSNFINKFILLLILNQDDKSCNEKNELINNDLFIRDFIQTKLSAYNSIRNNYHKYFKKLWNNPYLRKELLFYSKKIYKKYKLHGYSKFKEEIVKKGSLCNIGDIEYNKLTLQVYEWINVMNTLDILYFSKEIVLNPFLINVESSEIFKIFSRDLDSEYISKFLNYLQIMANTRNIHIGKNPSFNKSDNSINPDLVTILNSNERYINQLMDNSRITGMNNEGYIHLLSKSFSFTNISFDSTKNRDLFYTFNYNERFLFHWKKFDIENNIIYSQSLINSSKYNGFHPIIIRIKLLFLQKKIVRLAQLRLTNGLLSKKSYESSDKTEFASFSYFYRKLSRQNDLYLPAPSNIICSKKKIDKIGTVSYYKFLMKNSFIKTDSKRIVKSFLVPQLSHIKIRNNYNLLRSKSLIEKEDINSEIFQSINNIFLYPRYKYFKLKDLKYGMRNKILKDTDEFYKYDQFEIYNFFARYISFIDFDYILWFFTSEWWKYNIHIFVETFRKFLLVIDYHLEYFVDDNIGVTQKNLVSFCKKVKNLYNSNLKWNSRVFPDYKEKMLSNFVWSDFQSINNCNNSHWVVLSLSIFIYLFYQNHFSILIGSDSIELWKYFETIKYLTDTSQAFYLTNLMYRNKTQSNKTENLVSYFFSNSKYYLKNIRFYLLTKKKLSRWLIRNKGLDLSRRKRNLLVQSLITHTRIKEYGFQLYPKQKLLNNELGYRVNNQQGLSYFKYLTEIFKKNLVNYPLYLADKWIFFASLQKIISSQTLRFQKKPIPLQFGLSCSKGILLIGPIETGRSYLIKNLAADSYVPLLRISINKLLYNKPDILTESWMNILIESLRRLNLTLDFAKGMSPCIIWIQNIHQLDVNRSTQNIESDPTFLLGILLKHFQTESIKTRTRNNRIIIGSTHVPKKVDPSLISPDRLDRIINIRLFSTSRRKNLFPILLNRNNIQLRKNLLYFNDFGSGTMGYNMRDLAALTNEISLISFTKNESFIYTDIIKLAFHRQVLGFTHTNNKPNLRRNLKILLYKIGRTIVQNMLIEGSVTNPLNISNYLWKKKFYYLSKWYSEPPRDESIVKESTILVHVLGCLAGIAARDSWFLSEKDYDIWIPLDKSVENDLDLALSILESFSIEFPRLETCKTKFINYRQKKPEAFSTTNSLSIMQNGIFAIANRSIGYTRNDSEYKLVVSRHGFIDRKSCEFKNTAWSPRFWRLSFSRSHLFDWMKRPNDFEFLHKFGLMKKNNLEKKNHYDQLMDGEKEQLLYERILPRVRKRNVQELEYQFEDILLEGQFEILGFFCSSTRYRMEQLGNKPRLFIGKRILWDPTGSFYQTRHFVFSRREFFVDEEMLRRLYITYGVRREREQSFSNHRIKRFFIYRGYNKDLINKLSVRWWNQLPIDQKQNIYMLKRIERMGIRLKRPQIFTPVYLYQRWLIENIPEKFSRLKLLNYRDRWLKINNLLLNDSFTYMTLLESYQYLFEFFLSNKVLLNRMINMLLRKKWLFQNEIEDIIRT